MKVFVEQLYGMAGEKSYNMKLSDHVAQKSAEQDVKPVLMVRGGGAMHLNHALGRHKRLSVQHCYGTGRFS